MTVASATQVSMLHSRYSLLVPYGADALVVEVACGAGIGLGAIAEKARHTIGVDIDPVNIEAAGTEYKGTDAVSLLRADASALPLSSATVDVVACFEALYYFDKPEEAIAEAFRVLRPGGTLVLSAVNPQWPGFSPSPKSVAYHLAGELRRLLTDAGFGDLVVAGGFLAPANSPKQRFVRLVRQAAIAAGLVPRTLEGRARLKRLLPGGTVTLPRRLEIDAALVDEPVALTGGGSADHRVLYATGTKPSLVVQP